MPASLLEHVRLVEGSGLVGVRVDAEVTKFLVRRRLTFAVIARQGFVEVVERLLSGPALRGHTGLDVPRDPPVSVVSECNRRLDAATHRHPLTAC